MRSTLVTRTALAAILAAGTLAGAAAVDVRQPPRVDPFHDPAFPIYRWNPLVRHDRLSGRTTVYPPLDPSAPFLPDITGPRIVIEPDGTAWRTTPGGGARDWSVPSIDLDPDNDE